MTSLSTCSVSFNGTWPAKLASTTQPHSERISIFLNFPSAQPSFYSIFHHPIHRRKYGRITMSQTIRSTAVELGENVITTERPHKSQISQLKSLRKSSTSPTFPPSTSNSKPPKLLSSRPSYYSYSALFTVGHTSTSSAAF